MSFRPFIKFSILYIIFFILVHFGIFLLIKKTQKNYSQENLNKLLYTVSEQRQKIDDPCQNKFAKDPYTQNYYKIYIYCNSSTKISTNTIDLDAINDKSIKGVITEFARIMNFDPNLLLANQCISTETGKTVNFDSLAINKDTLKCIYNK